MKLCKLCSLRCKSGEIHHGMGEKYQPKGMYGYNNLHNKSLPTGLDLVQSFHTCITQTCVYMWRKEDQQKKKDHKSEQRHNSWWKVVTTVEFRVEYWDLALIAEEIKYLHLLVLTENIGWSLPVLLNWGRTCQYIRQLQHLYSCSDSPPMYTCAAHIAIKWLRSLKHVKQ